MTAIIAIAARMTPPATARTTSATMASMGEPSEWGYGIQAAKLRSSW
jgi:hypothetical protein